jgi:squalene monooxygenase
MQNAVDTDVVIGGAGVAGLAAAVAVQRLGYNVTLIEPGQHDDRRLAGEVFHPPGVAGLAELGLLPALMREPAMTVNGFSVWHHGECTRLPYDSVPAHRTSGLCLEHGLIRQRMLDVVSALPNISIKRGGRVVGIDQSDPSGVVVQVANGSAAARYRCRLLIAADGMPSRIGRLAGIGIHHRRISTIFGYRISTESLPEAGFGHVFVGGETPVLFYPISRGTARILFDIPYRANRRPSAADCLSMAAVLPDRLRREAEEVIATQPRMSVLAQAITTERSAQGRVVLVGDAGGSCHPLTATGMTMCVNDALLLQEMLAERSGDLPRALQLYQRRRRWPQATRLALADALRDAFCGASPELRVVRRGMLAYWRESAAGRSATLALLSTADGRPIALLRRTVAVMVRGFIAHLRRPAPVNEYMSALRVASSLVAALYRQVRQFLASPVAFAPPENLPGRGESGR